MRLRTILLFLACVLSSGLAMAEPRQSLTLGFLDFPPASYIDAQGRPAGKQLAEAKALLQSLGYRVELVYLPPARLYQQLKSGEVDVWLGGGGKPELSAYTLETRNSTGQISMALFYRTGEMPPYTREKLAGKFLISIRGYSFWEPVASWLTSDELAIQRVYSASHESALAMLMNRRADYLLSYEEPMRFTLGRMMREGQKRPQVSFVPVRSLDVRYIVSRRVEGARELVDAIDRKLAAQAGTEAVSQATRP